MKKQILVASLLCAITSTENYAKHGKGSHKAVASSVTTVGVPKTDINVPEIHTFAHAHYGKAIESLREGNKIDRNDLINLLKRDPYLVQEDAGGHAQFRHKFFSFKIGVIAHGTTDIESDKEHWHHYTSLQVYVDTLTGLRTIKPENRLESWAKVWGEKESALDNCKKRNW